MKKSRVLAMMLVVVMVVATMSTAVLAVDPPANSKVRVTEKTVTQTFTEGVKVWDIWDTEGNFGTHDTNGNVLNIKGGNVPFIALSGFGSNLENVDEIVVEYKTADKLDIQLRIREKGYSTKVELPATGGDYVKASLNMTQFAGGGLTDEDLKAFKSIYNVETGKYDSTAMLYLGSSDASIKSLNAYWYSYSSESNQVRKEEAITFGETTWGSWGQWTGGGSTQVPLTMTWTDGANEDGSSKALVVRGGNTGSGSYAGGQFMIPNSLDLKAVDAVAFRYKSTANINAYFNRAFQINAGETVPASEFEIIKGFSFDDKNTTDVVETYTSVFDENGKNISGKQWKKESKSSGAQLKSTGGKWETAIIPISKFGSQEFLTHMKTNIVNQSFAPCYHVRFEGCCYGDFATTGKEFVWGGFTAIWYEKLPTMSALSFDVNGEESEYLDLGTTKVNVELKNDSNVDINDSVLVVALYEGNKLIDMDVKLVDTPAMGTSGVQTLSVDLNAAELLDEHKLSVMLWDSADSLNQITNLAFMDAYGYTTE